MKTLKKLITYLPVIYLAWLLSSCGGGVEGIDIKMNIPITVNTNEEFVTQITVTNTLNNSQKLLSIDIGGNYLEGIALLKTEPTFNNQEDFGDFVSYSFDKEIGAQESITLDLYWKALSEGEFSDEIDFCINSDFSFISKGARTIVGGESGNTTTEITTETVVETTTETNPSKETNTSSSGVIEINAYKLYKEYQTNEIAADLKYLEKEIVMKNAKVHEITKDYSKNIYVRIECTDVWDYINCYVAQSDVGIAASLVKGDKITIQGILKSGGDNIKFKECTITK